METDGASALTAAFLARLPIKARAEAEQSSDLGQRLAALITACEEAWPALNVVPAEFVAWLAEKLGDDGGSETALIQTKASDLYLAFACSKANSVAIASFEACFFDEVAAAIRRLGNTNAEPDDVKQLLREKLFLAAPGQTPRISAYSGRGDLRAWLRVLVVRLVLNLVSRGPKEAVAADDDLFELQAGATDLELDLLKRVGAQHFKEFFLLALNRLTSRERNLLRHQYVDGLTIEQMAALHGVHGTTVSRWLGTARRDLLSSIRGLFSERLKLDPGEIDSLIRVVQSQIEVSLRTGLR
jgi:RNA polymerase sigma-70 factor (ECF subfamily)